MLKSGFSIHLQEAEQFPLSKAFHEILDVQDFLAKNPECVPKILSVFKHYGSIPIERRESDAEHYWRKAIKTLQHIDKTTPLKKNTSEMSLEELVDSDPTEPFYVADLGRIVVQYAKFKKNLPMVVPFYAVKCNNSEAVLSLLSALGGGFDCASFAEFNSIFKMHLAPPEKIIFANPEKKPSHLQAAERCGIRWVTFDSERELQKIRTYMPSARAVLRISTDDSAATCQFSVKFGAPMSQTTNLLERAKEYGVQVAGVSFHVGSGNNDPKAYENAIRNARRVFNEGIAIGHEMKLLDIGGGWPGSDPKPCSPQGITALNFEKICGHIRPLLEELFAGTMIIAEPGRYFAESTYTLAMAVHGMRVIGDRKEYQYYVGDGIYGGFNCVMYDYAHPEIYVLDPDDESAIHTSTIFGPTCDSLDCLLKRCPYPELEVGEWLFVPNFGAYTIAAGSEFNGYKTKTVRYISSLPLISDVEVDLETSSDGGQSCSSTPRRPMSPM